MLSSGCNAPELCPCGTARSSYLRCNGPRSEQKTELYGAKIQSPVSEQVNPGAFSSPSCGHRCKPLKPQGEAGSQGCATKEVDGSLGKSVAGSSAVALVNEKLPAELASAISMPVNNGAVASGIWVGVVRA